MMDKIYFVVSCLFFIIGIGGIFLPEVPGVMAILSGAALFSLLTQFRDIGFQVLGTYLVLALTAYALPKIIKIERYQPPQLSVVIAMLLVAAAIILNKHRFITPIAVLGIFIGDSFGDRQIINGIKKDWRGMLAALSAIAFEIFASQYIIFDFIWRVTSRFRL